MLLHQLKKSAALPIIVSSVVHFGSSVKYVNNNDHSKSNTKARSIYNKMTILQHILYKLKSMCKTLKKPTCNDDDDDEDSDNELIIHNYKLPFGF